MSVKVTKFPTPAPEKEAERNLPAEARTRGWTGMREDFDRMFDGLFGNFPAMPFSRHLFDLDPFRRIGSFPIWGDLSPKVDVTETDTEYKVTAELPGMDEKEIEVALADGVLTIKGEKKEEKEEKEKNYHLVERRYGSFNRAFRMPGEVEEEKIAAEFDKGVLTVTMPKTKEAIAAAKKIEVKAK